MAKTGIKIQITDTVLGAPVNVDATSMIITNVGAPTSGFKSDRAYKLTSVQSLAALGITEVNNPRLYKEVSNFYKPTRSINNEGTLLWIARFEGAYDNAPERFVDLVRQTVKDSFDERPRNIGFIHEDNPDTTFDVDSIQSGLDTLADDGIRAVGIMEVGNNGSIADDGAPLHTIIDAVISSITDYSKVNKPFVAVSVVGDGTSPYPHIGLPLGMLSAISVGTSIGDGGLAPMEEKMYLSYLSEGESYVTKYIDVTDLSAQQCSDLGEKQVLFTRTRPPRNGLWWNDGATANDPNNALSSLEMARTICSMADALQSFFVPYINTRVPVTNTGDIQSAYKQVVLDNARAAVVQKYIENGDISDARISLVAKNNDMIGTRTWEVTLSILPAPTLRWIDGYVFYVKSLE